MNTICPVCGRRHERGGHHDCPGPLIIFQGSRQESEQEKLNPHDNPQ